MDTPTIDNWYLLAAAVVRGLTDADELNAWRRWADERAQRIPVNAPKAHRCFDRLWLDTQGLAPTRRYVRRRRANGG